MKQRLGGGAFGSVHQALWNDAFSCAVKVLDADAIHAGYMSRCLGRLEDRPQHPGIIRVYAGEFTAEPPWLSMALLPESPVSFHQLGGALPAHEIRALLDQLAAALAWLHEQDLVHTGLSGGNVFVIAREDGEPQVIVTDLGQGWLGRGPLDRQHDQTPFLPPERWREPDTVLRHPLRARTWDVYAFGVIAWHLITGYWPRANRLFTSVLDSRDEPLSIDPVAFAKWLEEEPAPAWPDETETDPEESRLRGVIERCLALDPADRPADMREVLALLTAEVPWKVAEPAAEAVPDDIPEAIVEPEPEPEPESPAYVEPGPDENAAAGFSGWEESLALSETQPDIAPVTLPEVPVRAAPPVSQSRAWDWHGHDSDGLPQATIPVRLPDPPPADDLSEELPVADDAESAAVPAVSTKSATTQSSSRLWPALTAAAAVLAVGGLCAAAVVAQQKTQLESDLAASKGKLATAENSLETSRIAASRSAEELTHSARLEQMRGERDTLTAIAAPLYDALPPATGEAKTRTALTTWKAAAAAPTDALAALLARCDEDPALCDGGLGARWQLTRLLAVSDRSDEALASAEKLARDIAAVEALTPPGDLPEVEQSNRFLLKARTAATRAAIFMARRQTMDALPFLLDASEKYENALNSRMAGSAGEVAENYLISREYAANSLLEGQAHITRGESDDARAAFLRIASLLPDPLDQGLARPPNVRAEDRLILADTAKAQAELDIVAADSIRSSGGDDAAAELLSSAAEHYHQANNLLQAYETNHPESVLCLSRQAEVWGDLGRLLFRHGSPADTSFAYNNAVNILTLLTNGEFEVPDVDRYRLLTARVWLDVSRLAISTTKNNAKGETPLESSLVFCKGAVVLLRELNESSTLNPVYQRYLSEALIQNASLSIKEGNPTTAIAQYKEAREQLDSLLDDDTLPATDRASVRRIAADALYALGDLHEKAKRSDEALEAWKAARELWNEAPPDNPEAEKSYAALQLRLEKLAPEPAP